MKDAKIIKISKKNKHKNLKQLFTSNKAGFKKINQKNFSGLFFLT